jgi:hypothetical protein
MLFLPFFFVFDGNRHTDQAGDKALTASQRFVAAPISLVRLDELESYKYISSFTEKLRLTDITSHHVKLAAEEKVNVIKSKYSPTRTSLVAGLDANSVVLEQMMEAPTTSVEGGARARIVEKCVAAAPVVADSTTLSSFPHMIESVVFPAFALGAPLALPNGINPLALLSQALKTRKLSVRYCPV